MSMRPFRCHPSTFAFWLSILFAAAPIACRRPQPEPAVQEKPDAERPRPVQPAQLPVGDNQTANERRLNDFKSRIVDADPRFDRAELHKPSYRQQKQEDERFAASNTPTQPKSASTKDKEIGRVRDVHNPKPSPETNRSKYWNTTPLTKDETVYGRILFIDSQTRMAREDMYRLLDLKQPQSEDEIGTIAYVDSNHVV